MALHHRDYICTQILNDMKNIILAGMVALFTLSIASCGKGYDCECPSGTKLKVFAADEINAKGQCESQSNGRCTY